MRRSDLVDTQVIYCGDNLDQLQKLPDGCIDLIYIDPPFNSNRNYEVFWGEARETRWFEDRHESTQAYINFMRPRCIEMARTLSPEGSFYYHCDWHASHYVKVMLDGILGENNFQNEIIWKRTFAHSGAERYGPVHDTLLFYSKGPKYTWNKQFQPYDPAYIETFFDHVDPDGRRWMRMDLTGDGVRNGDSGAPWKDINVTDKGRHWAIPAEATEQYGVDKAATTQEKLDALDAEGAIHWPKKSGGVPRLKRYVNKSRGVPLQTLWTDIRPLHNLSSERIGYPTQKPLALLKRMILASSNEGDVILDAFCGCGTAIVAAQQLSRRWIGIDISPTACRVMAKRLRDVCRLTDSEQLRAIGRGFALRDLPWTEDRLHKLPPFEFENWAVVAIGGLANTSKVGDMGIDGRLFPVTTIPKKGDGRDQLSFMNDWYPIQVKQKDKTGRPDIDSFEAVMIREDRTLGYFVSFEYTADAEREVRRFEASSGREIRLLRVADLIEIDHERMVDRKKPVQRVEQLKLLDTRKTAGRRI